MDGWSLGGEKRASGGYSTVLGRAALSGHLGSLRRDSGLCGSVAARRTHPARARAVPRIPRIIPRIPARSNACDGDAVRVDRR